MYSWSLLQCAAFKGSTIRQGILQIYTSNIHGIRFHSTGEAFKRPCLGSSVGVLEGNIDTLSDLLPKSCVDVSEYLGLLQADVRIGGSTQVSNDIGNEVLLVGGGKALPLSLNMSKGECREHEEQNTYENTGLLKVLFSGNTNILDSSSNPGGVVIVIVRTGDEFQCILTRSKHGAASLVVE